MGKTIDFGVERLMGNSAPELGAGADGGLKPPLQSRENAILEKGRGNLTQERGRRNWMREKAEGLAQQGVAAEAGTFYLETFGCQMNDHDSEKVAGVMVGRGYTQVEAPGDASVILYNTCSIREKAEKKVFSRLG